MSTTKRRIGERMACKHCGQDIEWSGRSHGWTDRGGNRACVPFIKAGEVVKPKSKHSPYIG